MFSLEDNLSKINSIDTDNFLELVSISGLNKEYDFRFANFEGMDFSDCDLRGFDFTGSDFTKAIVENTSFDGAIISKAKFRKGSKPLRHVDPRHAKKMEKKSAIISAISLHIREDFRAVSETLFESREHSRVVCTTSKKFEGSKQYYWYAYHPRWDKFLEESPKGYLALGCLDLEIAFLIPRHDISSIINNLNITSNESRMYWHIQIIELDDNRYELKVPRRNNINLEKYKLAL